MLADSPTGPCSETLIPEFQKSEGTVEPFGSLTSNREKITSRDFHSFNWLGSLIDGLTWIRFFV